MVTINTSSRYTTYNPVGLTTNFPVGFPIFSNSDIVLLRDGAPVAFTVTATYVDGVSEDAACVVSPGITGFVEIIGKRAPRRTDQYQNGAPLPIRNHNYSLNRLTIESQEARRDVDRAWKSPYGVAGKTITFGTNGQLPMFDGNGNLVPAPFDAEGLTSVIANLPILINAPGYASAAQAAKVASEAARDGSIGARNTTEGYRDEVEADRIEVQNNKVLTAGFADAASNSASSAAANAELILEYGDFNSRYIGEHATDPTNWNSASPLNPGTDPLIASLIYYNTAVEEYRTYSGSVWASGAGNTSDFARKSQNGLDYDAGPFRDNLDLYSTAEIDAMPGAVASKTTPIDADSWTIWDSVASAWKRVTGTNLKAYLKAYFDTLYQAAGNYVTTARNVATQHSLTGGGALSADRTINLVNDTASPGNNKVYGTNGSGTRGWKDDPAGGGYTWLASRAATSGSTSDETIPSSAVEIVVILRAISLSGTDNLWVQLGDSGGIEATGYVSVSGTGGSYITQTSAFGVRTDQAGNGATGTLRLFRVGSTNEWVCEHNLYGGTSLTQLTQGVGTKTLSDAITTLRLTRSGSNTFDGSGSWQVGYR